MSFCEDCLRKTKCSPIEQAIKDKQGSCIMAETNIQGFSTGEMVKNPDGTYRFIPLSQVPSVRGLHAPIDNLR